MAKMQHIWVRQPAPRGCDNRNTTASDKCIRCGLQRRSVDIGEAFQVRRIIRTQFLVDHAWQFVRTPACKRDIVNAAGRRLLVATMIKTTIESSGTFHFTAEFGERKTRKADWVRILWRKGWPYLVAKVGVFQLTVDPFPERSRKRGDHQRAWYSLDASGHLPRPSWIHLKGDAVQAVLIALAKLYMGSGFRARLRRAVP